MHAGFTGRCAFMAPAFTFTDTTEEIPMKRAAIKRVFALAILACFSTAALTACNTMAGAGKDVQKVGQKVEQKAEDCKDSHC